MQERELSGRQRHGAVSACRMMSKVVAPLRNGMHAGHHRQDEGVLIDGTGFSSPSPSHTKESQKTVGKQKAKALEVLLRWSM